MKPHQWRRSPAGKYLRHFPRIKHIRGTWLHRRLGDRLFHNEMWTPDRQRFAAGCAVGTFFSMIPLPFQMLGAAVIAFLTRCNIPAAIAFTWVSNPLTAAFFIYLQYKVGAFILGYGHREPPEGVIELLKRAPLPVLTGSGIVGIVFAILVYPLALWGWDLVTKRFLQPARRAKTTS